MRNQFAYFEAHLRHKTAVQFGIKSQSHSLESIATSLHSAPSLYYDKGGMRPTGFYSSFSLWILCSRDYVDSLDIPVHVEWLLHRLEPHSDFILSLKDDSEYEVFSRIDVSSPHAMGGTSIPSDLMIRLATLSNRVDLSFWGYVPDDNDVIRADGGVAGALDDC